MELKLDDATEFVAALWLGPSLLLTEEEHRYEHH
jgi:hypothetical protein